MFGLNKKGIKKAVQLINTDREASVQKLQELQNQISGLTDRVNSEKELQSNLDHRQSYLSTASIILEHWPTEVVTLREKRFKLKVRATSEDITVAEHKRLCEEIVNLDNEIRKSCPHPFVIGYRGYEGSYSYDYDDGYEGKRLCIVCGFTEYSNEKNHEIYELLSFNGKRLVADTALDKEKGYDATQSFEELVKSWIPKRVYELQKQNQ